MVFLNQHSVAMVGGLALFACTSVCQTATAATAIVFPKGSYCASYSGNFSKTKSYSLNLRKGQDFEIKAANMEDGIRVHDRLGVVKGSWIDDTTYHVRTRSQGNHVVTVGSPYGDQRVQFCAY